MLGVVLVQLYIIFRARKRTGSWRSAFNPPTFIYILNPQGVLRKLPYTRSFACQYLWADYVQVRITGRFNQFGLALRKRKDDSNKSGTVNVQDLLLDICSEEQLHHFVKLAEKYIQIEDEKRHASQ